MNLQVDVERLLLAQKAIRAELLAERTATGHWTGHIASSPLATAAAVSALVVAHNADLNLLLRDDASASHVAEQVVQSDLCEFLVQSVNWLAENQNPDGGWGDCIGGKSTLAATMLVQAAFRLTGVPAKYNDLILRSDQFIDTVGGASALRSEYREDRAFCAAVLATCAIAGTQPWSRVPTLAFEHVCLPKQVQQHIPLSVRRPALPVMIAIGRAKFLHDRPRNPITRLLRRGMLNKSLQLLEQLQSADDSFLSSIVDTAFVVIGLSASGCRNRAIVDRGVEFLLASVRGDASWPVVANLATRVTSLTLSSIADENAARVTPHTPANHADTATIDDDSTAEAHATIESYGSQSSDLWHSEQVLDWLLACQHTDRHAATEAAPGGWACNDARGALPNTLDTASTLLALASWPNFTDYPHRERVDHAARLGATWLLDLQQSDGGWSNYDAQSRGFQPDSPGPVTTARALCALSAWRRLWRSSNRLVSVQSPPELMQRIDDAIERGWQYLEFQQQSDGNYLALWFGNEYHPEGANPVVGTAWVLECCAELNELSSELARRAACWLLAAQHTGGGWGPPRAPVGYSGTDKDSFRAWRANDAMAKYCSIEETALAVRALLPLADSSESIAKAASAGLNWLVNATEQDLHRGPAAIGFLPSRIWYHERLYPLAFIAGVFSRAAHRLSLKRPTPATVG